MNRLLLKKQLTHFFIEDIGDLDITSHSVFRSDEVGTGILVAKEEGILSGTAVIHEGYHLLNPSIEVKMDRFDGEPLKKGDAIAEIFGPIRDMLAGERVILNLLQRMSGIATMTRKASDQLHGCKTNICDTRKTMPGLRMFDKYAVRCGGGVNHRKGLYDGVMLKDNHIAYIGSIKKAVELVRKQVGHMVKIEVETESKEEVLEAVEAGADVIMFDNRSPEEIKELVRVVPEHIITEASGGITVDTVKDYRNTGVDFISLGELTHSTKGLDISFNLQGGKKS